MIAGIAVAAFVATFLGGLFALKLRDKLHLILGFSAGAVVAVAFFDLLPEALSLGAHYSASIVVGVAGLGFILYLVFDRFFALHGNHDEEHRVHGHVGAGTLSLHSFLDGIGIGFAFQVSQALGLVVAVAVLVHDFSDGINTVTMITKNGGSKSLARRWLFVDALAPVAGIVLTMFISVSEGGLALLLALFSGFFLYIGASDLIPESHHAHPTFWTTFSTVLGALVLFVAIKLAGV